MPSVPLPGQEIVRLPWGTSVVGVVRLATPAVGLRQRTDDARRRLAALYEPVLGPVQTAALHVDGHVAVVAVSTGPVALEPTGCIVWGRPLGAGGDATDEEVRAFAAAPSPATSLGGQFAVLAPTGDGVRVLTTADTVHGVRAVRSSTAEAVATKGLAAHVLAGREPTLHEDAVAEYVLFDYVLGADDLLAASREVGDGAVVTVDALGVREEPWWSLPDRLHPTPPPAPVDLWDALRETVLPAARAPDVWLGLTGGRDSTLVAAVAAAGRRVLPTFTLGGTGDADVVGAASVAAVLGWDHHVVGAEGMAEDPWARVLRCTAWTEGLDTARNLVAPLPLLPRPGLTWLGGNGGETGRAFYWRDAVTTTDPGAMLLGGRTDRLSLPAAAAVQDRVAAELAAGVALGFRGPALLDVFYARNRMRKWLGRIMPVCDDLVFAYLAPRTIRTLVNVSDEGRQGGRFFDECLALGQPDLRRVARAAIDRAHPASTGGASVLVREVARRVARRPPRPAPEWVAHRAVLQEAPTRVTVARRILGERWFSAVEAGAPTDAYLRRQLWSALAVEALAQRLDASIPA